MTFIKLFLMGWLPFALNFIKDVFTHFAAHIFWHWRCTMVDWFRYAVDFLNGFIGNMMPVIATTC